MYRFSIRYIKNVSIVKAIILFVSKNWGVVMKFSRFISVALIIVVIAFLFGNSDGAVASKSNIEKSLLFEQKILEQTGICINLN